MHAGGRRGPIIFRMCPHECGRAVLLAVLTRVSVDLGLVQVSCCRRDQAPVFWRLQPDDRPGVRCGPALPGLVTFELHLWKVWRGRGGWVVFGGEGPVSVGTCGR